MKERFALTGALLIILVGTGMAILAQLPGAGPKLTRTTQVTPEEAFEARQFAVRLEQNKDIEKARILQGSVELPPAHPCEWMYQKALEFAIAYDQRVPRPVTVRESYYMQSIEAATMWNLMYQSCKQRLQ